jgi:ribosomal protein S18 acetylase RimI-like enzyme
VLDGYELVDGSPSVEDYLRLRERSGLTHRRPDQAEIAVRGSWAAVNVIERNSGTCVGMGRVLGDGGWYFHIVDMAVLPEHQRKGIGEAVLAELLDRIRTLAPPGAFVSLLADPPGRALYVRHGFVETAPTSLGMAMILR